MDLLELGGSTQCAEEAILAEHVQQFMENYLCTNTVHRYIVCLDASGK